MKYLSPLALALAVTAGGTALAQVAPPQGMPPTPSPQMRQQFRQMRSQMQQIRTGERSQILSALSPAHRTLLANVVGQLATSVNPDFRGAASRLDSALSAAEKNAIVNAFNNARSKQRALFESMRSQFPRPSGMPSHPPRENSERQRRTPSAGALLLRMALPGPGFGMMGQRHGMRP
jgi:hypothetical protein